MKLQIKKLSKSYGRNQVLENVDFTFQEGKIYGLIGRNGSGKTTFFNALANDIEIDSGDILLDGKEARLEDIGYVLAAPNIPEFLTGREFLKFFLEINEGKLKNFKTIDEYFEMVGIESKDRDKIMREYSYGMKNKMQMLIHIISNPKILLLDEPLTSFDIVVQDEMKKLLKQLKKDHILIFSTHILEIAMDLCDEIVIIHNRKLELIDAKDLNKEDYKNKIIESLKDHTDA